MVDPGGQGTTWRGEGRALLRLLPEVQGALGKTGIPFAKFRVVSGHVTTETQVY